MEKRKDVIKHSAAIQISSNITLLQRRAWNVLLANAYDELPTHEKHCIRVADLVRTLEFDSKNDAYVKGALEALIGCKVKWNLLNKDGSEVWGVAALLAEAEIENGLCTYAYGPTFRKRLHNPRIYARISLSLQNQFDSKHALALWELCVDYLGSTREYGETPFIPLERFRELMGLQEGQYQRFKDVSNYVIKPAITEINCVSDLKVTVDYQRQGRKVVALKFKIRRVSMLPQGRQATLFPDLDDTPTVIKLLTDAGVATQDAWEVWQESFNIVAPDKRPAVGDNPEETFVQYVKEKIHLLHQRREVGKVSNPAGFLLTAIKKNYGNAKLEQEAKGRARKRQAAEASRLEAQKRQVTRDMEDTLHQVAAQMIEAVPDLLTEAIAALQAEDNALMSRYNARKSPLNNFRDSAAVTIAVSQWLEHRFPERFAKARQPFSKQLAGLTAQLEELAGRKVAG